ncbi:MAG: hypothetical protein KJO07_05785 [Deltaproteobacteria bacterium]|nr:hypothetical protein [Deltaproteobacteria bacterium]
MRTFLPLLGLLLAACVGTVDGSRSGPDSPDDPGETGQEPDQPDQPLAAIAGPDRQVIGGLVVKLDGSESTGAATHLWEQVSGPPVEISEGEAATAWASIPSAAAVDETFVFRLTVSGADGNTVSALKSVTVKPAVFERFTDINDPNVLDVSEGIAFNDAGMWVVSQEDLLTLIDPAGEPISTRTITGLPVGANFDINGDLVIARNTTGTIDAFDPALGSLAEITDGLATANYPLPDRFGNVYVTNRQNETVFRYDALTGQAVPFVTNVGDNPNAAAFGPEPDMLYVGTIGKVYRIPILPDGSAGTPEVYLDLGVTSEIDGITFDEGRNIYVGAVATKGLYIAPYVADGPTSVARSFLDVSSGLSYFTNPTHGSSAFGETTLFYTNLGLDEVGKVDVGLPRLDAPLAVPR